MSQQCFYGFPCVSDPNDFSPDYESCSPEEIAAHKRAVETFGTPDYVPNRWCVTTYDESGKSVSHVLRASWGIGVNTISACDGCSEPNDKLIACHDCGGYMEFCEVCWPEHTKTCEPRPAHDGSRT